MMRLSLAILGATVIMLSFAAAVHSQSTPSAPSITVYANPT